MTLLAARSGTETLTAYSTLAAVVVALGVALTPAFHRWWSRPRLEVEVGNGLPFARTIASGDTYLRFQVRNTGRGNAIAVSARVTGWWCKSGQVPLPTP
jgi:hypothetical protein